MEAACVKAVAGWDRILFEKIVRVPLRRVDCDHDAFPRQPGKPELGSVPSSPNSVPEFLVPEFLKGSNARD